MSRLEVSGLSVRFGGVTALDDVSIAVDDGELVGLIGPNGAGKTTLLDAVCGFVPSVGMVLFSGSDLGSEPPHMRAKAGVSRTWQGGELFEDLSVGDNVRAALEQRDKPRLLGDLLRFDRRPPRDRVLEILTAVGLSGEVDSLPRWLPHGKRKLVGVARAMAADAKLIFLDEPAAGLSTLETDSLAECLHRIRRTGIGLLLVEHDIRLVDGICERVYVLDRGTILASGTPAEVLRDERVVAAYLGNTAVGLRDRDELGAR